MVLGSSPSGPTNTKATIHTDQWPFSCPSQYPDLAQVLPVSLDSDVLCRFAPNVKQRNEVDVTRAKKAAKSGPVFITDRGKPAHMLLSFEDYQRLTRQRRNIADALAMPGVADIEFEPPRVTIGARPANLS